MSGTAYRKALKLEQVELSDSFHILSNLTLSVVLPFPIFPPTPHHITPVLEEERKSPVKVIHRQNKPKMSEPSRVEQNSLLPSDNSTQISSSSSTVTSSPSGSRRPSVIHYNSLSVDCRLPNESLRTTGSAQIVESDLGADDDFWNIHVDLIWNPRGLKTNKELGEKAIKVSVDHLLTLRMSLQSNLPKLTFHLHGGRLLGQFSFPNGSDAATEFLKSLKVHVEMFDLHNTNSDGDLFALESIQRMRRIAPRVPSSTETSRSSNEDYSALLQDLSLGDRQRRGRARPRGAGSGDLGMTILSHFAKVTQAAREVGEDLSLLLDEKKRRAEMERRERERVARRRALDIYADIVASTDVERELPPRLTLDEKRGVPVKMDVWRDSLDGEGKFVDVAVMKQAIFAGGVERQLRAEVWPFVLGFYSWDSSSEQRVASNGEKEKEYAELKEAWSALQKAAKEEDSVSLAEDSDAMMTDRRKRVSKLHSDYLETEEQIAKDIIRTDRDLDLYKQDDAPATLAMGTLLNVYATYDNRITYCQGMSDFLSPILHVFGTEEEALVFWCFEALMRRIEGNFRVDQSGMRAQLSKLRNLIKMADEGLAEYFEKTDPDFYCCFRWIIVRFKRELPFEETERFWEVLWTRQVGGDDFHIFVAGALLLAHRRQLLSLPKGAFDSLLRYINDMSMRIDVNFALREGELCYRKFGKVIM